MQEDTVRREERLVLEARLANYLRNLKMCAPGDRAYWELLVQQARTELVKFDNCGDNQ